MSMTIEEINKSLEPLFEAGYLDRESQITPEQFTKEQWPIEDVIDTYTDELFDQEPEHFKQFAEPPHPSSDFSVATGEWYSEDIADALYKADKPALAKAIHSYLSHCSKHKNI
jgi:hypothetical protein